MADPKMLTPAELDSIRRVCAGETVQRLLGHIDAVTEQFAAHGRVAPAEQGTEDEKMTETTTLSRWEWKARAEKAEAEAAELLNALTAVLEKPEDERVRELATVVRDRPDFGAKVFLDEYVARREECDALTKQLAALNEDRIQVKAQLRDAQADHADTVRQLAAANEAREKAEQTLQTIRHAIPPEACGTCGAVKATLLVNYGPEGRCRRFVQIEESSVLRMLISALEQYEAASGAAASEPEKETDDG